jgi:Domain of unknown function (DUF6431)
VLIVSFPLELAGPGCTGAAHLAACNTNCPWRRGPPAGTVVPCPGRPAAVLLCADADAASADLASGVLACPSCGPGPLRPWGSGRERAIRLRDGTRTPLRPRRGRCGSCRATHVLLPSWSVPRRADAAGVIASAAVASALHGTGTARIGAQLGVPAATVRGWLRRLRSRAGAMRQDAMTIFGRFTAGRDARRTRNRPARRWATRCPPSPPARTPQSPSTAAPRRPGSPCWVCSAWPASSPPPPAADRRAPARAPSCPCPGRDAHHEHPGPPMPCAVTVMSIPPTP